MTRDLPLQHDELAADNRGGASGRTSPTITTAIAAFLADLAVGKSPATLTTYRAALRRFHEFLLDFGAGIEAEAEDLPIALLTEEQPIDFARYLIHVSPTMPRLTLLTYTTAVMRFYAFLVREGFRVDLPLPRIAERMKALRGKRPRALPRVPDDAIVEAILTAARQRVVGDSEQDQQIRLRDIAIIETLRGSGIRVSELVGLRRGDLIGSQQAARVTGKGNKGRTVFLTSSAWRSLTEYFATRQTSNRSIALQPVFIRHDRAAIGRLLPLSTKSVREIVRQLSCLAQQADAGITPHRFRAWFATHMVEETGDLAATQDLLGHESADTTRVYTRVASQRLRERHRQAFAQLDHRIQERQV